MKKKRNIEKERERKRERERERMSKREILVTVIVQ